MFFEDVLSWYGRMLMDTELWELNKVDINSTMVLSESYLYRPNAHDYIYEETYL